jgi:hypothetical protein
MVELWGVMPSNGNGPYSSEENLEENSHLFALKILIHTETLEQLQYPARLNSERLN